MTTERLVGQRSVRWRLAGAEFGYVGGLNTREDASELNSTQWGSMLNVNIIDGGASLARRPKVFAPSNITESDPGGSTAFNPGLFYSQAIKRWILIQGGSLEISDTTPSAWSALLVNAGNLAAYCVDFNGECVLSFNGKVYTIDNTGTATQRTTAAGGGPIAVWQNKVWVISGSSSRLNWCAAGDAHTWNTSTDFVDIREKNDRPLTGLIGGSGLLVFKQDSSYRVNDSTTGSYQTIDWFHGAFDGGCYAQTSNGLFHILTPDGLYSGTGVAAFKPASLLVPEMVANQGVPLTSGGYNSMAPLADKLLISIGGAAGCSLYEYDTNYKWFTKHQIGGNPKVYALAQQVPRAGTTTPRDNTGIMAYTSDAGKPFLRVEGILDRTGTFALNDDTTTAFTGSAQSGFIFPAGGYLTRISRMQANFKNLGGGAVNLTLNTFDDSSTNIFASETLSHSGTPVVPQIFQPQLQGRMFQVTISDIASSTNWLLSAITLQGLITQLR